MIVTRVIATIGIGDAHDLRDCGNFSC